MENRLEIGLSNRIKKFINNIELSSEQKTKIQKSHQYLRKHNLDKLDYVSNTFLTGSYKKSTLINHSNNDVDMFVVLNDYDQYNVKPNTILDKLEKELSIANNNLDNQIVPLIKMMKKCKIHNNIKNIQSFEIEKLAIDNLSYINNYRNGIEQLVRIYSWTQPNYTHEEIENFTDIVFAKFCRDSLFGICIIRRINMNQEKILQRIGVDTAYTFKGLHKIADILQFQYKFYLILPIVFSIISLGFSDHLNDILLKILAVVALVSTFCAVINQKNYENITSYRKLANEYKIIYDEAENNFILRFLISLSIFKLKKIYYLCD